MKKRINITLDNLVIEKADKLSNEYHMNRSSLINYLICNQYDCYNMATNIEVAIATVRDSMKKQSIRKIL